MKTWLIFTVHNTVDRVKVKTWNPPPVDDIIIQNLWHFPICKSQVSFVAILSLGALKLFCGAYLMKPYLCMVLLRMGRLHCGAQTEEREHDCLLRQERWATLCCLHHFKHLKVSSNWLFFTVFTSTRTNTLWLVGNNKI